MKASGTRKKCSKGGEDGDGKCKYCDTKIGLLNHAKRALKTRRGQGVRLDVCTEQVGLLVKSTLGSGLQVWL